MKITKSGNNKEFLKPKLTQKSTRPKKNTYPIYKYVEVRFRELGKRHVKTKITETKLSWWSAGYTLLDLKNKEMLKELGVELVESKIQKYNSHLLNQWGGGEISYFETWE